MAQSSSPSDQLTPQQVTLIKHNATKLADLPEPGTTWLYREMPDGLPHPSRLAQHGLIIRAGRVEEYNSSFVTEWEVTPEAWAAIESYASQRDTLPCGHVGFTNLPDSDAYQCNTCGATHGRDDLPV